VDASLPGKVVVSRRDEYFLVRSGLGRFCRRPALIVRRAQLGIGARLLDMLVLRRNAAYVLLPAERCFLRCGARRDSPVSTIVAHSRVAVNHSGVVGVMDSSLVHAIHRSVVEESRNCPDVLRTEQNQSEVLLRETLALDPRKSVSEHRPGCGTLGE
jgi:hypothetical protein